MAAAAGHTASPVTLRRLSAAETCSTISRAFTAVTACVTCSFSAGFHRSVYWYTQRSPTAGGRAAPPPGGSGATAATCAAGSGGGATGAESCGALTSS
jgi:hypothetical protein